MAAIYALAGFLAKQGWDTAETKQAAHTSIPQPAIPPHLAAAA